MALASSETLRTKYGAQAVRDVTRSVVQEALGQTGGPLREEFGWMMIDIILTNWHTSFITKSMGREDEFGDKWKPLSEKTIEKKLRGEMVRIRRPGGLDVYRFPPSPSVTGGTALIPDANRVSEWYERKDRLVAQLITGGMSPADAQSKANSMAWQFCVAKGGVPINVDTGHLAKSLEPGQVQPPNQIRRIGRGYIETGTNVTYARDVHGQRPLLPVTANVLVWVMRAVDVGRNMIRAEIINRLKS